jgi:hypothetical protein
MCYNREKGGINMSDYKVVSYAEQALDKSTLKPKGKKVAKYAVYKKVFPFPNKSIFEWENVKNGFRTEKQAINFMERLVQTI